MLCACSGWTWTVKYVFAFFAKPKTVFLVLLDDTTEGEYLPLAPKKHTRETQDSSSVIPVDQGSFKRKQGEGVRAYLDRIDRETNERLMEQYKKARVKSERKREWVWSMDELKVAWSISCSLRVQCVVCTLASCISFLRGGNCSLV